jgi:hypothetical protein
MPGANVLVGINGFNEFVEELENRTRRVRNGHTTSLREHAGSPAQSFDGFDQLDATASTSAIEIASPERKQSRHDYNEVC